MNEQNLVKGGAAHTLTVDEQSKGGKASGESRRKKKAFRELFEQLLSEDAGTVDGKPADRKMWIAARAFRIISNDETSVSEFLRAFEIIRDTIGEKPVDKVMIADVEADIIAEVERMVNGDT